MQNPLPLNYQLAYSIETGGPSPITALRFKKNPGKACEMY